MPQRRVELHVFSVHLRVDCVQPGARLDPAVTECSAPARGADRLSFSARSLVAASRCGAFSTTCRPKSAPEITMTPPVARPASRSPSASW